MFVIPACLPRAGRGPESFLSATMCEDNGNIKDNAVTGNKTVHVTDAVGMVLAHDITEIRPEDFKGRAFKKGHVVRQEDVEHLRRLGKENLFVLNIASDEMHENDAAYALAAAMMGGGVEMQGPPTEGKINIIASKDGLLKINKDALLAFNMHEDVMCASLHTNTVVKKGQTVAGTRAIPLVIKKDKVRAAAAAGRVIEVIDIRKPKAGLVVTGNEVYYGRIKDAFAPVIRNKIEAFGGEMTGIHYAPDDTSMIEARMKELINAGADILILTGGMSVDPDDVTRHAVRNLGAAEFLYGSPVLPGAMFLVAYLDTLPILGVPACGMYSKTTVLDIILPRVLAGERIQRKDLAELGHGGLCQHCKECRYPVCPFGK